MQQSNFFDPYQLDRSLTPATADAYSQDHQLLEIAQQFIRSIPIFLHWQKRTQFIQSFNSIYGPQKSPFGNFFLLREPVTARSQKDVMPNTDTLYGATFLDLDLQGPLVITVPKISNRFWSLQFVDQQFYNYDYISVRTDQAGDAHFLLVKQDWQGEIPAGIKRVLRSPSASTQVYQRIYFQNQTDLPLVHQLQDQIKITTLASFLDPSHQDQTIDLSAFLDQNTNISSPREFFTIVNDYAGLHYDLTTLSDDQLVKGIALGQDQLSQLASQPSVLRHGWEMLDLNTGRAGKVTPLIHALTQIRSMGANDAIEAIYYLGKVDATGQPLKGNQTYQLTFAHETLPPIFPSGFWSVTLYDAKKFQLIDNPWDRYAIKSKDHLHYNIDGSLTIISSVKPPTDQALFGNWLPTQGQDFLLVIRFYVPQAIVTKGEYLPPTIQLTTKNPTIKK